MDSSRDDPLEPELTRATRELSEALDEACRTDVNRASTGELLRVEKVLAAANEAARTAVSIRRRRSVRRAVQGEGRPDAGAAAADAEPGDAEAASTARTLDVEPPSGHRVFTDAAGGRWEAFAVYPNEDTQARARLPDPFRTGWLTFECGDEKRRLSPVPDGWNQLDEPALRELCDRADRVPRRPGALPGGEDRGPAR